MKRAFVKLEATFGNNLWLISNAPKIRVRDFFGADFAEIRGAERFWRSPRRCRAGLRAGRGRKGRRSGTGAKDQ